MSLGLSIDMNCDMVGAQCGALAPGCNIIFNGVNQSIAFHALEYINKTVMMAYFNNSDLMLARVQNEAQKAKNASVEFFVALNLQPSAPWTETFYDKGLIAMDEAFDSVSAALKPILGYDFTRVIHTYGARET